eukprot:TRINITY_DN77504_c0_g1_i1.p2 TRINITY_DN77504_c0_g1~~TRINITY_DN77504_c0_g1_i1.p2  ORF type:complete len:335 (+),score=87.29 TRINITY_DN77504_c0_g1_i1:95-1099(+)
MATGVKKTIEKVKASGDERAGHALVEVPDDFEVDKDARYTGIVLNYSKWRGFGHIDMEQKGLLPGGDEVFAFWKNIQSDDRFPRLKEGVRVEFGLMATYEWRGWRKVRTIKAKHITLPGGGMINLQDQMDAESMKFVGAQNFRYTGTLKFFDAMRGFGWVALDDGFAMDDPVPKEIKVESQELNTGSKPPPKGKLDKMAVEFGIVKGKAGDAYFAYNMTLPGGVPITQENLEHRQEIGADRFAGSISWFNSWQGWGHLIPDPSTVLPAAIQQKLDEEAAKAQARKPDAPPEKVLYFRKTDCEWGVSTEVGTKVTFSVYVDDKGAGACKVSAVPA